MKASEFKFCVVTKPKSEFSTVDDICFQTSLDGFALQLLGGLKMEDILFVTDNAGEATTTAHKVLGHWKDLMEACK